MASNKSGSFKKRLAKENNKKKRAPVWVYVKSNRKVRRSPKSDRHWRRDNIF